MFKKCNNCGFEWLTRDQWLQDPDLKLIGYQVNYKSLKMGILLFNHTCRTTLALQALDFEDLYTGQIFIDRATDGDGCPGYCLHQHDLRPCPSKCECAYIRHILQLIRNWPKDRNNEVTQA
jgi:hypothetical protein